MRRGAVPALPETIATGAAQQAVEADGRASSCPAPASLSPVVMYHGLARRHLMPSCFLMRPLLNGGTLGRREVGLAWGCSTRATGTASVRRCDFDLPGFAFEIRRTRRLVSRCQHRAAVELAGSPMTFGSARFVSWRWSREAAFASGRQSSLLPDLLPAQDHSVVPSGESSASWRPLALTAQL